jgi:hypothetical protein
VLFRKVTPALENGCRFGWKLGGYSSETREGKWEFEPMWYQLGLNGLKVYCNAERQDLVTK